MRPLLVSAALFLLIASCSTKHILEEDKPMIKPPPPVSVGIMRPVYERTEDFKTVHGIRIDDPYSWIRDLGPENERVRNIVREENLYSKDRMSDVKALKNKIYLEILSRIEEDDVSVPVMIDDYFYYSREVKGSEYPVYCRRKKSMDSVEEVVLDLNALAEDFEYLDLGLYRISPDHKHIAYSLDTEGDERYTLYIKDLSRNRIYARTFENVDDLEWAEKDDVFFYTVVNDNNRADKVFRHALGTDPRRDRMMYEEKDESFSVWINKSRSREYLFIGTGNKTTSEIHYLKSDDPMSFFELISPRIEGVEYYPDHRNGKFYFLTNDGGAYNFKIMRVGTDIPVKVLWKELIPHSSEVYLDDFDVFKDYLVLSEISDGRRRLRLLDFDTMTFKDIHRTDASSTVYPASNPMFDSSKFRYYYESMTEPYSVIDYDVTEGVMHILKTREVKDYDSSDYESELIFAKASDGEKIPVSVVYRRDKFRKGGSASLLLEAYGAYGDFFDPVFSASRLSLLDRGFVYAVAHVRGGIEKGKKWHDSGMLLNKKNTFTDFLSVAEHLINSGYTVSDKLVIKGGSAGGMLVGAVLNMRPDLFRSAVLEVPFLDVLNTMLDPTLHLTVAEYDEWGDPGKREYFDYIRSYCPYQNIKNQDYPDIFVTSGMNDPRIGYWEAIKWTAKVREYNTAATNVLLTISETGHGGASGRYDHYKEIAQKLSFILKSVGIEE